jgi:hypothetical protein
MPCSALTPAPQKKGQPVSSPVSPCLIRRATGRGDFTPVCVCPAKLQNLLPVAGDLMRRLARSGLLRCGRTRSP